MPKNSTSTSSKSTRKPLRDVSNSNRVKSLANSKKKLKLNDNGNVAGDNAGDRLLLVHSDLSSLIHQIDELVVQAFKLGSKKCGKEIESFANVLSDIQASLKPWVPIFQKALSNLSTRLEHPAEKSQTCEGVSALADATSDVDSPTKSTSKWDSRVSPSPLVSWRANCMAEGGARQLFMLTPLPRPELLSFKRKERSSKLEYENVTSNTTFQLHSLFEKMGDMEGHMLESAKATRHTSGMTGQQASLFDVTEDMENLCVSDVVMPIQKNVFRSSVTINEVTKKDLVSPIRLPQRESSLLVSTPCLKMSPPKSCVLLEPLSEYNRKDRRAYKSTPFPVALCSSSISEESESSSSQASDHLTMKYPELFGISLGQNLRNRGKVAGGSPNWLMSPPKTCVLMEPPEDKLLTNAAGESPLQKSVSPLDERTNLSAVKQKDVQGLPFLAKETCYQDTGSNLEIVESTPMMKEPESSFKMAKHPGENTLKKELWTMFEAASTHGIRFSPSRIQKTERKCFLDRLDEV